MTPVRRHLAVVTWTILSLHALGVPLGVAQACREREHTHGGVAADDCPMHHRMELDAQRVSLHSHHGHASSSDAHDSRGARLSCHCPGDASPIFLGQVGVPQAPTTSAPFIEAVVLDALTGPLAADRSSSPPSPPPR
jgi:hypothetical protein